MDIEDLSKSQLLLLTILVNFVVSIATGVLTVSLLDQAPTTVTQTVNRIVDHTIETVTTQVPVASEGDGAPTTEELLTSAIAGATSRSVSVLRSGESYGAAGVLLPASRTVATVSSSLPGRVTIRFPDGTTADADRIGEDGLLKLYAIAEGAAVPAASGTSLVASADVKAGQTAIALDSSGAAVTGIVSKSDASGLAVNLPGISAGTAVVNLSGGIIGIAAGDGSLIGAERIGALIPSAGQ